MSNSYQHDRMDCIYELRKRKRKIRDQKRVQKAMERKTNLTEVIQMYFKRRFGKQNRTTLVRIAELILEEEKNLTPFTRELKRRTILLFTWYEENFEIIKKYLPRIQILDKIDETDPKKKKNRTKEVILMPNEDSYNENFDQFLELSFDIIDSL